MNRIKGLDSIRFICAFFVMIGHFGFPLPAKLSGPGAHGNLKNLGTLINLVFNGPASVIVFFIISGFCIHFPFRGKDRIDLVPYYIRRLLRISIPAFVAVLFYLFLGIELKPPLFSVFWSVMCEIIYYILYPALLAIKKHINWVQMIAISYLISLIFLFNNLGILQSEFHAYPALGYSTWIVGLPCWLLGCLLSENYEKVTMPTLKRIWILRFFILLLVLILDILRFQVHNVFASNCFILNLFAFAAYFWIGAEIRYFQQNKPSLILEWAGKWSYSLYIMHFPIAVGLGIYLGFHSSNPFYHLILLFSYLVVAYFFYLVIEKPSHKFSVFLSSKFALKVS